MQRRLFGCATSIAGMSFIALGSFIFYRNLIHLLGTVRAQGPSVIPNLILAASRTLPGCGADHQHFAQFFLLHTFTLLWPLLLAITGTVLSRDFFTDNFQHVS